MSELFEECAYCGQRNEYQAARPCFFCGAPLSGARVVVVEPEPPKSDDFSIKSVYSIYDVSRAGQRFVFYTSRGAATVFVPDAVISMRDIHLLTRNIAREIGDAFSVPVQLALDQINSFARRGQNQWKTF